MATFTETQQNRYRWYVMAFALLAPSLVFWQAKDIFLGASLEEVRGILLAGLGMYLLFSTGFVYIMLFRKITTHINQDSIQFCIKPFGRWQTINWAAIERVYVREFTLWGEYPQGLGGYRQGANGYAYVINGTYGLQINKKSGGKILLGTQRPDELQAFLNTHVTLTVT